MRWHHTPFKGTLIVLMEQPYAAPATVRGSEGSACKIKHHLYVYHKLCMQCFITNVSKGLLITLSASRRWLVRSAILGFSRNGILSIRFSREALPAAPPPPECPNSTQNQFTLLCAGLQNFGRLAEMTHNCLVTASILALCRIILLKSEFLPFTRQLLSLSRALWLNICFL